MVRFTGKQKEPATYLDPPSTLDQTLNTLNLGPYTPI